MNRCTKKKSIFDSDSDIDDNKKHIVELDFEVLYEKEKKIRIQLENKITELNEKVKELTELNNRLLVTSPFIEKDVSLLKVKDDINRTVETVSTEFDLDYINSKSKWELLAEEEKTRKQQQRLHATKQRTGIKPKLKSIPIENAAIDPPLIDSVDPPLIDSVTAPDATKKQNGKLSLWDESSEDEEFINSRAIGGIANEEDTLWAEYYKVKSTKDKISSKSFNDLFDDDEIHPYPIDNGSNRLTINSTNDINSSVTTGVLESNQSTDRQKQVNMRRKVIRSKNPNRSIRSIPKSNGSINPGTNPNHTIIGELSHTTSNGLDDNSSGWDSDDAHDRTSIQETRTTTKTNNNNTITTNTNATNPDHDVHDQSTQQSSSNIEEIAKEIDKKIIQWVQNKNLVELIRTVGSVYSGELPRLGPRWEDQQDQNLINHPVEVRKAYFKIIRYCHPDKLANQNISSTSREAIEAQKVFTVLTDSYYQYKSIMSE